MYCPKCNLHSEEYVDKCPLCDGPMEVDEVASGVMKTPPIPEDGGTEELPLQEAIKLEEDLDDHETVAFDQELLADEAADIEPIEGIEDLDASQSGELDYELEEAAIEAGLPPELPFDTEESGGSKKTVLLGFFLLIILLAASGYYYFFYAPQSPEPTKKSQKKVAATKKTPPADATVGTETTAAEKALMTKASEPADLPMKTAIELPDQKVDKPVGTKTEKTSPSGKTPTMAGKQPVPEEPLPTVAADLTSETKPAIASPDDSSLSAQTPAEMALADAKKALEKEPLPLASPDGRFLVNASSFREESLALALKDKLIQSGYPASTVMVELPEKGTWYRVIVGGYANREEAGVVSERIKVEENLDTWIANK